MMTYSMQGSSSMRDQESTWPAGSQMGAITGSSS